MIRLSYLPPSMGPNPPADHYGGRGYGQRSYGTRPYGRRARRPSLDEPSREQSRGTKRR
jgi:hypothetical protein